MVRHTLSEPSETDPPRQKTTLFCPACGHSSPVDGDWIHRTRADSVTYVCPVCYERLTERPRQDSDWSRALQQSMTAWGATVTAGVSAATVLWRSRRKPADAPTYKNSE